MTTYFRLNSEDEDPDELLRPENQVSKPWGGADKGACAKCGQTGRVVFKTGEEGECPSCRGTGEVTEEERRGVSVFPDADTLYRYMLRRDADVAGSILVELEGRPSGDFDFDADEGAVLVHPTAIVRTAPIDEARMRVLAPGVEAERRAA